MPVRRRHRPAMPRARSGRPRPGGWIPSSTISRPPAARWYRWPRATARQRYARLAKSTAVSLMQCSARLAAKVDCIEYPELGMEAIWRIEVVDFPAFIVIDDKGNDFFKDLNLG